MVHDGYWKRAIKKFFSSNCKKINTSKTEIQAINLFISQQFKVFLFCASKLASPMAIWLDVANPENKHGKKNENTLVDIKNKDKSPRDT